jgi:hypothetical protein
MAAQVERAEEALDELTAIWTAGDSNLRVAVTSAANAIDVQLQHDPLGAGESRSGDERILFEWPLAIVFSTPPDGSSALVLHLWRFQ